MTDHRIAEPPLLEGRKIDKYYGGLAAIRQVDFAVHRGEMVGVIGPNGSGKTTLFDCLTRVQELSQGQVFFKGIEITHYKPHQVARLGMARTFQGIRVYRQLTVLENMLLSRQWRGEGWLQQLRPSHPRTQARARELIDFLTLHEWEQEQADHLSVGQQRLLEIGMALMPDPDLLLLDEATSGVNPTLAELIKDRIQQVNREQGKTIVLIEHNFQTIADLCSRVVVLDHGEKLVDGTPHAAANCPQVIDAYFGTPIVIGGGDHAG